MNNKAHKSWWPAVERYLIEVKKPVSVHQIISEATTKGYGWNRKDGSWTYGGKPLYKIQKCPTPNQLTQTLKANPNVVRIEGNETIGHGRSHRNFAKTGVKKLSLWRWKDEN